MGLVRQRQGLPYQSLHTAPGPAATSAAGAPYGKRLSAVRIELVKLVWYGKGRVCRTNLSTQPRAQQPLPQPRVQQSLPQPRAKQSLPQPGSSSHFRSQGPAATSAAGTPYGKRLSAVRIEFVNGFGTAKVGFAVPISPRSPGTSSHFRSHEPRSPEPSGPEPRCPEPRCPGPSSPEPRSPEPSSHFRSQGPSAKATRYRKRGRFCAADSCKRATELYLRRSRRR